jgi:hypothetical protein
MQVYGLKEAGAFARMSYYAQKLSLAIGEGKNDQVKPLMEALKREYQAAFRRSNHPAVQADR